MPDFLAHGGEMGRVVQAQDWRASALGPLQAWPTALRSMLATLFGSAEPMFMCWGPQFLAFFNDAYRPLLGVNFNGTLGRPSHEQWTISWPTIRQSAQAALQGHAARQENLHFVLPRNGQLTPTWWTLTFLPFRDASGQVVGFYGLPVETTQSVRLERERQLEERQQTFRIELSDALRDAPDPDALMRVASEKMGRHLQADCAGYAELDESGRWLDVEHDWRAPGFAGMAGRHALDGFGPAFVAQLQAGQTVVVNDTARVAPGGICLHSGARALMAVPLLKNASLAVVFFVLAAAPRAWSASQTRLVKEVAGRAWTSLNRLRAELDVRNMNQALKDSSAELMASQTALRQSQKLEVLGQLTGGVAHDFNNLLALISSSVELLRTNKLPPARAAHYLDLIFDTVGRAVKLTAQLLAFARQQPLEPEVFDVDQKVQDVVDLVRPLMGAQVRLAYQPCGPGTCFAEADISQFETALVNLAVNARDAMNGSGQLQIQVRPVEAVPALPGHEARAGEFIAISVGDTGCGIAPELLESIFEPFYTTKEVGKGTGLGLSQVFGFAKQSGGDVLVHSQPGRGSVFTLYLRRMDPARQRPALPAAAESAAAEEGVGVLVVEDNDDLAQMTCEILESQGYRTVWAANAAMGLKLLAEGDSRFDLVFSDVIMPGMNGVEFAEQVRQRYPRLPVVLTSGYSSVITEQGRHGFELVLKPYTSEALVRAFNKVLHRQPPTLAGAPS